MNAPAVVVVGAAATYPGADSAAQLFDLALHQRTAFRAIPPERLPTAEYGPGPGLPDEDSTYVTRAGLIDGWTFAADRFRIPRATVESADPVHWLALDVADRLLVGIGAPDGDGLPRARTGVILGNSLGGEVSRANALRLRWPYVLRSIRAAAAATGTALPDDLVAALRHELTSGLAVPGDETLAGALSNTIAGRICNYYDFHGTGYTVDGACASSLIAVVHARDALRSGALDVVIAGGVDISLDPLELVGFSRLGALSRGDMRIYDREPTGFLPGEGCGLVAMMREETAHRLGLRALARVAGAGMSSDGAGGLTRPAASGHLTAALRAYADAGIDPAEVALFEGHGTGTAVGDPTELEVFGRLRPSSSTPALVGSIKANIGHTKAAAGIAGLIKAVTAVDRAVVPPSTGVRDPHAAFSDHPQLRVAAEPDDWPAGPRVAGVSALGFGGINAHVVLTQAEDRPRRRSRPIPVTARSGALDVLVLTADSAADLLRDVDAVRARVTTWSDAECHDLAVASFDTRLDAPWRLAVPFTTATELSAGIDEAGTLVEGLREDASVRLVLGRHAVAGTGRPARLGLLFPGQAAPVVGAGTWFEARVEPSPLARAACAGLVGRRAGERDTAVAQPAIVSASLLGLAWLDQIGADAVVAVGHSLGELTALAWAGAVEPADVIDLATERGSLMVELGRAGTAMLSVSTTPQHAQTLMDETGPGTLTLAATNSPSQVVVAGDVGHLDQLAELCRRAGIATARLPVSHGFHSPAMEPVRAPFAQTVAALAVDEPSGSVVSTVTGRPLRTDEVRDNLVAQLTAPVRFSEAVAAAADDVDLWLECGPGTMLSTLVSRSSAQPAVALDVGGHHRSLARAVAALVAAGQVREATAWTRARPARPVRSRPLQVIPNPCGAQSPALVAPPRATDTDVRRAPRPYVAPAAPTLSASPPAPAVRLTEHTADASDAVLPDDTDILEALRAVTAEVTGLDARGLGPGTGFARDLHLNSLQVGQLVQAAATRVGRAAPSRPTSFADATFEQVVSAIDALPAGGGSLDLLPVVTPWVESFVDTWVPLEAGSPAGDGPVGDASDDLLVALGRDAPPDAVVAALRRCAAPSTSSTRTVVVHAGGHAGVARSVWAELRPESVVSVETTGGSDPGTVRLPRLAPGFHDLAVDPDGGWWRRVSVRHEGAPLASALTDGDVCLVTGGVGGITAECVDELAAGRRLTVVVAGRTPADDPGLCERLARWRERVPQVHYVAADVTDPADVERLVRTARSHGPVTALVHGAGVNRPRRLADVDLEGFRTTDAVKSGAFELLTRALGDAARLVVTFGSIIGRGGLEGQGEYAVANDRLRAATEAYAASHPQVRVRHLEWGLWSGVGMGEGLGVVDTLTRQGITPIGPVQGRTAFLRVLHTDGPVTRLVTGRAPRTDTIVIEPSDTPPLRFVERVRARTGDVELVAEAEVGVVTDHALSDHRIDGLPVLPGVVGLEAVAQVATALVPEKEWRHFRGLRLSSAVVAPMDGHVTVQVGSVVRHEPDGTSVLAQLRGGHDGFAGVALDVTVLDAKSSSRVDGSRDGARQEERPGPAGLPMSGADLYGPLFFHSGVLRRVVSVEMASASRVEATVRSAAERWFSAFLPQRTVLGDLGALDASIHVLQVCHPARRLLPVGAEFVEVLVTEPVGPLQVSAREVEPDADDLRFDVDVTDARGELVIRWRALAVRPTGGLVGDDSTPGLLAPRVARLVREHTPCRDLDALVTGAPADSLAVARALGLDATRLPTGRLVADHGSVSSSRSGPLTLTVVSRSHVVGVDVLDLAAGPVPVAGTDDTLVSRLTPGLGAETSAAAAWTAREAMTKAGVSAGATLELAAEPAPDAPVLLTHGAGDRLAYVLVATPGRGLGAAAPVVAVHVGPPARGDL